MTRLRHCLFNSLIPKSELQPFRLPATPNKERLACRVQMLRLAAVIRRFQKMPASSACETAMWLRLVASQFLSYWQILKSFACISSWDWRLTYRGAPSCRVSGIGMANWLQHASWNTYTYWLADPKICVQFCALRPLAKRFKIPNRQRYRLHPSTCPVIFGAQV